MYERREKERADMQDILIAVDLQNDFIDGALGTPEAVAIVPRVREKVAGFAGKVLFTRDTHQDNYLDTQEGRRLPVPHCIEGTDGWQICDAVKPLIQGKVFDKPSFGSVELGQMLRQENEENEIRSITLVGLCTDICVIANAMLIKAFLPEVKIVVDASCCAGVTPQSHKNALEAMKMCQIEVTGE